jgi:hypothetical protein
VSAPGGSGASSIAAGNGITWVLSNANVSVDAFDFAGDPIVVR